MNAICVRANKGRGIALSGCATVTTLAAALSAMLAGPAGPCAHKPLYSRKAVVLSHGSLRSPDGRRNLTVRTILSANGSSLQFTVRLAAEERTVRLKGFNAEVLWAPDSSAFGVTEAEGGGGFGYRAYVFSLSNDSLKVTDVSPIIEKAFHMPGK